MGKEQIDIEVLKARGLNCSKLKSMEEGTFQDAKKLREVGFVNLAAQEEAIGKKIGELRKRVCVLK